jgi:hypothetical protein
MDEFHDLLLDPQSKGWSNLCNNYKNSFCALRYIFRQVWQSFRAFLQIENKYKQKIEKTLALLILLYIFLVLGEIIILKNKQKNPVSSSVLFFPYKGFLRHLCYSLEKKKKSNYKSDSS